MDYKKLLSRAKAKTKDISAKERFEIPQAEILYEGKITIIKNFADISDVIRREPQQFLKHLLGEVGIAGNLDGRRVIFKGVVPARLINDRIKEYIETFVLCTECNRPDTRLEKEARTIILKCESCGAHRPVTVRKVTKETVAILEEGKTYDVMIQDISHRGDGVVKIDKYIIFVPNVVKGANVKIRIDKISGSTAFGKVVKE